MKKIILCALAGVMGLVVGLILCVSLTPVFWKLESVLKIELAGHSGPADWLLGSFSVFFGVLGFVLSWKKAQAPK